MGVLLNKGGIGEPVIDGDGRVGGQKVRIVADGRVQVVGCHYSKGHYAATTLLTLVRLVLRATAEEIASEKP